MLSALEMTLADCGYGFEPGSGIQAAQASFLKSASSVSA
jgi:hypothetical protein